MELIYAAMLLHKAGKDISEDNVKKLLSAVGIHKTDGEVKALVAAMADVDIDKAIKQAVVPVASPSSSSGTVEVKKEEKEEVKEDPEKAAAGLGALFG